MNKKIIKNKNCNLEIEGKEKFKIKIKDKEILNYYFYLNSTSFISKEEAKELLEFNKELSGNFPEIKIYLENFALKFYSSCQLYFFEFLGKHQHLLQLQLLSLHLH